MVTREVPFEMNVELKYLEVNVLKSVIRITKIDGGTLTD